MSSSRLQPLGVSHSHAGSNSTFKCLQKIVSIPICSWLLKLLLPGKQNSAMSFWMNFSPKFKVVICPVILWCVQVLIKSQLPHSCTHLTCKQSNAQNSPSQASTICERELPDVQAGFRKGRGTGNQIANIHWIIEKAKEFQKKINLLLLYWLLQRLWMCGLQQTVENFERDGNTRPLDLPLKKSVCRSRSNN